MVFFSASSGNMIIGRQSDMNNMSYLKRSMFTAECIALCIVLPLAFHPIQNAGNIFLPMHIPVLLCGLICGGVFGLLCGLLGPFLSCVITGMPLMALLPGMMTELAIYGLGAGCMMSLVRTKKLHADLYISLFVSMLAGRLIGGAARAFIFLPGNYTIAIWAMGAFVTGLPGAVIQLILLPAIVRVLEKAALIPERYPKG